MIKVPIAEFVKGAATVAFLAVAIYGGYSVVGYATGTLVSADAIGGGDCASCGSSIHLIDGPMPAFGGIGEPAGGGGGITFVPPPPPPPPTPPQCTLTLTKDTITWTTMFGFQVLISPLTNSPQIPGLSNGSPTSINHTETEAYNSSAVIADMQVSGINLPSVQGNTGFSPDQVSMNRVCALLDGAGSVASNIGARNYSSPGNNAVVSYNGFSWTRTGGVTSHMSTSFTCGSAGISTYPLNGSYNFVPPLTVGTHTYHLVVNGVGGTQTCDATIVIPPPPPPPPINGCIQILKETYNTASQPITPVAQFSFKLDGATTTMNDANGNASFLNVAPGVHTVTETIPPTWTQLSVTPVSGIVNVQSGSNCAAVVFKNKQVLQTPDAPSCTLHITPNSCQASGQVSLAWTTMNATSFVIDHGIGSVTPVSGGSKNINPTTSTTYTGTVTGPGGTATCSDTVVVTPPPPPNAPTCTLTSTPNVCAYNDKNATLAWTTINATSVSIDNGVGSVTPVSSGTKKVSPASTTTYTATVSGPGGTVHCSTTVTVEPPPPPPGQCNLTIIKAVGTSTAQGGDEVEYSINFKNTGDADCTGGGVKLIDVVDSRLTYKSETHSGNVTGGYGTDPVFKASDHTIRWNAATLTPGESGWVKWKATVGTPAQCSVIVPNTAKITSSEYNNFGTWVESNVANLTVTKDCTPPPPPPPPPPAKGCIQVLKETFNTNSQPITPVAQFTFKLDGSASTTVNDANGNALFQNVLVGQHTVTEVVPPTWTQLSITPVSGTITVTPGPTCAAVVFKNKQVLAPPPKECKLIIDKSADKTTVDANGEVEYTINFKNIGDANCTGGGVHVVDVVDSRLTYKSETHSGNVTGGYGSDPVYKSSTRTVNWNADILTPGESGWVKFKVKANVPTECSVTVPNKAKITAKEYNNFMTWVESNNVDIAVTKDCNVPTPACTLSADPTTIETGHSSTLTWTSSNVTSVSIDQGIGSVALNSSKSVSPTANTIYTGTFTGPGGTVKCSAQVTVTIPPPPGPACTLSLSASQITAGQSIVVSWTSTNAIQGFVTSVGSTTPVSSGSSEVFPSDDTTYVGTFTASDGRAVTCVAPLTVSKGGGGCQGNCGGGLNPPNVVLFQKPTEAPLAFVSLAQIPYTGFEAGFALTVIFWLAVGLLAAIVTYFVMGKGGIQILFGRTLQYAGVDEYEVVNRNRSVPQSYPNTEPIVYSVPPPAPTPVAVPITALVAGPATNGIPELSDVIESRAHGAGVLMSPEAVLMAGKLATDRGEVLRKFGDILNEAVKTIPREDGWVLLTSDRFEELMQTAVMTPTMATPTMTPSVESILASVMTPPAAPIRNVEMPMSVGADQNEVMKLAIAILGGNRDAAYATARSLEAGGAHASSVMTVIATALDQAYRARKHGTTTNLTLEAANVSDETLAKLVEIFTHGMDHSYTNAFTSLKLAVAQAFEARG